MNTTTEASIVYALVVLLSLGYCTTPSRVTSILSLFGGMDDSVKLVVLPSPVKLSTVLSSTSKTLIEFDVILPQKTSFISGAD